MAAAVARTHTLPTDLGFGSCTCLDSYLFSEPMHQPSLSLAGFLPINSTSAEVDSGPQRNRA